MASGCVGVCEREREKEREKGCARRGWGGERGEEKYRTLCVTGTGHQQLLNATPT